MRRIARKNENNKFIMIHNLRRAKNNENNKSQNHNSQFTDELMKGEESRPTQGWLKPKANLGVFFFYMKLIVIYI